ncbi:hypothetical protein ACSBR2_001849 [Camellia fascicularis]
MFLNVVHDIAQKKISKRKRDEYHVKEESPHANTSSNVDMLCVNHRFNMTGLLRCLRQIPFWHLLNALRTSEINLDKCIKYDDVVVHVLQTYKVSKDAFYIEEKKMNMHDSDIKLIFGIDCGTKPMDISYGAKPKIGIINKRCKNIRTLLTEALNGKKKYDNEEVARLVCVYACQKIFFSTGGETIGWGYYAHMVPLQNMQEYYWAKQIRTTLTSSISQNDKKPIKVTGCVMLLMYWLYEHTTILQPHKPNVIPRCVKWDLTALHKKMKSTSLVDLGFNKRTTLKVEPQCDEPATTSPELANIKEEQHSGSNSEFPGKGVDLNDNDEDINIPFSSPPGKRAIVTASASQPDIIDMLVKENRKAWGIIRQWEAKYTNTLNSHGS